MGVVWCGQLGMPEGSVSALRLYSLSASRGQPLASILSDRRAVSVYDLCIALPSLSSFLQIDALPCGHLTVEVPDGLPCAPISSLLRNRILALTQHFPE